MALKKPNFIAWVRYSSLCLIVFSLWACQTRPLQYAAPPSLHPPVQIWLIESKLALRTPHPSQTAYLTWTRQHTEHHLQLRGPFQTTLAELSVLPHQVTLTTNEGRQTADSVDALAHGGWGLSVPFTALAWWIQGLPDPTQPISQRQYHPTGLLKYFQQGPWHIQLEEYGAVSSENGPYFLPHAIEIKDSTFTFKFVINQWILPQ